MENRFGTLRRRRDLSWSRASALPVNLDLVRRMLNAQPTSGTVPASSAVTRDMRIDFFRGLAL